MKSKHILAPALAGVAALALLTTAAVVHFLPRGAEQESPGESLYVVLPATPERTAAPEAAPAAVSHTPAPAPTEGAESQPAEEELGASEAQVLEAREEARQAAGAARPVYSPGGAIRDEEGLWQGEREVTLFRTEYDNETGAVTVDSVYDDALIAPGTARDYTFTIENTGDCALSFALGAEGEASFLQGEEVWEIPIQVKLLTREGAYILGSETQWAPIGELNTVDYRGQLSAGCYTDILLQWQWAYEQEDVAGGDLYDTALGDLAAAGETLEATMSLAVTAWSDANASGGMPRTGDTSPIALWMGVGLVAAAGLVVLLMRGRRRSRSDEA